MIMHSMHSDKSPAPAGAASWWPTVSADSIAPGDAAAVRVHGRALAIFRVGDSYYATDNLCTHAAAPLADGYLDGEVVECPLHQGLFNVRTGKALCTPPLRSLRTYPVRVQDGLLEIWL